MSAARMRSMTDRIELLPALKEALTDPAILRVFKEVMPRFEEVKAITALKDPKTRSRLLRQLEALKKGKLKAETEEKLGRLLRGLQEEKTDQKKTPPEKLAKSGKSPEKPKKKSSMKGPLIAGLVAALGAIGGAAGVKYFKSLPEMEQYKIAKKVGKMNIPLVSKYMDRKADEGMAKKVAAGVKKAGELSDKAMDAAKNAGEKVEKLGKEALDKTLNFLGIGGGDKNGKDDKKE